MSKKYPPGVLSRSTPKLAHSALESSHRVQQIISNIEPWGRPGSRPRVLTLWLRPGSGWIFYDNWVLVTLYQVAEDSFIGPGICSGPPEGRGDTVPGTPWGLSMRPAVINDRGVQSAVSGSEARRGQQGMTRGLRTLSSPASPAQASSARLLSATCSMFCSERQHWYIVRSSISYILRS